MLKRQSVTGQFYLGGVDRYVTFQENAEGGTDYILDTGKTGTLPLVTRMKVKEAMSALFKKPVQPVFIPYLIK